jgi:hypothetical protein
MAAQDLVCILQQRKLAQPAGLPAMGKIPAEEGCCQAQNKNPGQEKGLLHRSNPYQIVREFWKFIIQFQRYFVCFYVE